MQKSVREAIKVLKSVGLKVGKPQTTNGGHMRVNIQNKKGDRMHYVFSVSPSDHRRLKKMRADARRFARHGRIKLGDCQ